MIKFKTIRFKNVLNFGNSLTEFTFPKGITRISGINGAGKSSLLDALNFVLFGKPYRKINLNQLINSINKTNLYVELEFSIKDNNYLIKRGIKPNLFEIYKNGNLIPLESHNLSYQNLLETKILYMDEDIFNQTVTKSMTKNISFISLSKQEKRELIENIFNLDVFYFMKEIISEKLSNNKLEINTINSTIKNLKILIDQEENHLKEIEKIKKDIMESQKKELEDKLEKIETRLLKITEYKPKLPELQKELSFSKSNLKTINQEINSIDFKIQNYESRKKELGLVCGDCPKIKILLKDIDIEKLQKDLKEYKSSKPKLEKEIDDLNEKLIKLQNFLKDETPILKMKEESLSKMENIEKEDFVYDNTNLLKYNTQLEEATNKYNDLSKINNHYLFFKDLFQKDTLKTFIIDQYLPVINKILQTYLDEFGINLRLKFDSDFSLESLNRYSQNLSYFNMSEGEKRRVDLSVLLTFLDFLNIKNKFSRTNLLILDEITAGLDIEGKVILGNILKKKSDKLNIFLIDHTNQDDIADTNIEVVIKNGFSKILNKT